MASQPAPTPTPAAPDPFEGGDQAAHIADIFGFDPDEDEDEAKGADASDTVPGDAPAPGPEAGGPAPADGSSVGAGEGEAGALEGASAEPPAVDESKLELDSLKATVARLEQEAKDAKEAPPKPADPAATPDATAAPKPIEIKLPDNLRDAITSGDDDQMLGALDAVVSGLATQIQQAAHICLSEVAKLRQLIEGGSGGAPAADTSAGDLEVTKESMRKDYFSKFPAHKAGEFQPILAAVATEMAGQFPGHEWNDQYINAMGVRVAERAKALAAAMNPANKDGAPPAPLPGGPRSAGPAAGETDISDEIMDTLGDYGG